MKGATKLFGVTFALHFCWRALVNPYLLFQPEFFAEGGTDYFAQAHFAGWHALWRPDYGYLALYGRLIAWGVNLLNVPLAAIPFVYNLAGVLIATTSLSAITLPFFRRFIADDVARLIVSLGLAFAKVDGLPLITYIAYVLSYALNPKKYTFRKEAEPYYQPPPDQPPQN